MRRIAWYAAICAVSSALPAMAQEELEELVVTAGFRDTGVMDSAGSNSVIAADVIENRAAWHLESILNAAPNVSFSGGGSHARFIQIRGVGDLEQFVDPKHYPSVGINIDSINLAGTANAAMLLDVDQVEILRGPQGTRFGTTALAGLVNIRGQRPTDEFAADVQVGVGSYGSSQVTGTLGSKITDNVSARFAVGRHESDGYIDNVYLGRSDTNGFDETAARAVVEYSPKDEVSYSFTTLYFDGDNGYDAFSLDNSRRTITDNPGWDAQDTLAFSGSGSWLLDNGMTLEAVATWLDSELDNSFDEDWTYVGYCDGTFCDPVADLFSNTDRYLRDRREYSVDTRVLGRMNLTAAREMDFVLGVYGQRREEDLHREYYVDFFSAYETDRLALYAQMQTDLTKRLSLTAGLRLERFDDGYSDNFGFSSGSDDTMQSGEISLDYSVKSDLLLYGTISRGEKAGGVNTEASANLPYMQPRFQDFITPRLKIDSESLTNLEVGVKGTFLDRRLGLRAALFHMDRKNAQLESWIYDSQAFIWVGFLDNANGSNWGAELEVNYAFSDAMKFFGALGYLETEVDELTVFDLDISDFLVRRHIDQAKAPSVQYYFGMDVDFTPRMNARIEFEGRGDSRFGYYHDEQIGGYDLLNASFNVDFGDTELQLWGRNLTDEDYAVHGLYFGNDPRKGWVNETYLQLGEPRILGVTARHRF